MEHKSEKMLLEKSRLLIFPHHSGIDLVPQKMQIQTILSAVLMKNNHQENLWITTE